MLTDSKLRAQVDSLWDKLWSGGLANPLDAIEQISFLLFLKRLDDEENRREKLALLRQQPYQPRIPTDMRWGYWTRLEGSQAIKHLREEVFPWFRILVNAYQHILEQHTPAESLTYDDDGWPHNMTGELLPDAEREFLQTQAFRGYDNDSGMTMLRIGSMNLMLHGIEHPRFYYMDTLSKDFKETREYDAILMNPPFKGAIDKDEVSPTLPSNTTKTELLFLHLILRALDMGGRVAVIVPDGVLFGSSNAHMKIRRKIIEENRLDGVVSMPSGVFKPYAGVSTAVLFFTRGGTTERTWFYDMEHDGFSLDDKRQRVPENDIPDILNCWRNRHNPIFQSEREQRLADLRNQIVPLKTDHLELQAEINRLTFESVISPEDDSHIHTELEAAQRKDA